VGLHWGLCWPVLAGFPISEHPPSERAGKGNRTLLHRHPREIRNRPWLGLLTPTLTPSGERESSDSGRVLHLGRDLPLDAPHHLPELRAGASLVAATGPSDGCWVPWNCACKPSATQNADAYVGARFLGGGGGPLRCGVLSLRVTVDRQALIRLPPMRPGGLRFFSGALVAALTASACSGSTPTSSVASSSRTPLPSALRLGPCAGPAPGGARCGTLTVPLDYSDPSKGTISLGVITVPAQIQSRRIGSLVVNPGGPGSSGVQYVEKAGDLLAALNQRFDIVGFDPRGTAAPGAVTCEDTPGLDHLVGLDPVVDDASEKKDLLVANREFAQACEQRSGRLLPYVGTENVARDMDVLRAALGEDKLTYFGVSYGTAIGAEYAALFPTRVRAMALDGGVDPSISLLNQVAQQADAFEASYREFVAQCKAKHSCPLGSDPDAVITKLLRDLDAHPTTLADGRTIGRGAAITALVHSMYSPDGWDQDYVSFAQAAQGDLARLVQMSDRYNDRQASGFGHALESGLAVNCVDAAAADVATYIADAQQLQARDPHFGAAAVSSVLACAYWPVHGREAIPLDITGAAPILIVGGLHDPATPYAWSQSLQREIRGSVLISRNGFGHTSYSVNSCIAALVDAYLADLTTPADGTTCSS
jgi:pimeloyl-ACP methyl ester carboxylesterase